MIGSRVWHMVEAIALMKIFSGFELLRERALTELNSTAQFYRHAKTGAELLSLINDDENKVFGIIFRTPPRD
jgi:Zn-dependent M16 (insulinase) family peptidase